MITLLDYQKANWDALKSEVLKLYLRAMQGTADVNVAGQVWRSLFTQVVTEYVPMRTITIRPNNKLWMRSRLFRLSRIKRRFLQKAKRSQSNEDWQC